MRDQSAGHLAKVESEVASESVCSLVPIVWPLMGAIYERVANLWSGQLELGPRAAGGHAKAARDRSAPSGRTDERTDSLGQCEPAGLRLFANVLCAFLTK
jgi:hypothetical protein